MDHSSIIYLVGPDGQFVTVIPGRTRFIEAGSVSVLGGAAHNFGFASMLWRGIGIGPIADAIALVFPEHGRDTADFGP